MAFDSYQLNPAEKNYPLHEKKLLAIVKALKKWRSSLLNVHFEVMTDHQTLEYFQSQREMSRRQSQWSMYLADFDYDIHYIKGKDNPVADALSRLPNDEETEIGASPLVAAVLLSHTHLPKLYPAGSTVLSVTADDEFLNAISIAYDTDNFTRQLEADIASGSIVGIHRSEDQKLVYIGNQLVIPKDNCVWELLYH